MKKTWIVLANAARARVFEREVESGHMLELLDLVHPQSREKAAELTSDQEGHAQKAHGDPGRSGTAFAPHTTPHRKELAAFAAEISRHLEVAATEGRFGDVALIASDPFLGELKAHLGSASLRALSATVPHDFTAYAGADLDRRVTAALAHLRY